MGDLHPVGIVGTIIAQPLSRMSPLRGNGYHDMMTSSEGEMNTTNGTVVVETVHGRTSTARVNAVGMVEVTWDMWRPTAEAVAQALGLTRPLVWVDGTAGSDLYL